LFNKFAFVVKLAEVEGRRVEEVVGRLVELLVRVSVTVLMIVEVDSSQDSQGGWVAEDGVIVVVRILVYVVGSQEVVTPLLW
jgi:hypothetical protein